MKKATCTITGEEFNIPDLEIELRQKFDITGLPTTAPWIRLRHLAAFWQHWALHSRKCDKTGNPIISALSDKCPYPVWHKDQWMKHANPPNADFDFEKPFFEQTWKLFQTCPIPHNVGSNCQNCEYTDDMWYSKNCYLTHSGVKNEDLRYCYRVIGVKDSEFCTFTFDSELCLDLVNCFKCFDLIYALHCRNCRTSAFLYDCHNCTDCMFCSNLRNKQYCFGNTQLTKDQYLKKKTEWNLSSREKYNTAKNFYQEMMQNIAWHRAVQIDKSERSTGDLLENTKQTQNCFFMSDAEDLANCMRGGVVIKNCLEAIGLFASELLYSTTQAQDKCYDCRLSGNLTQCRFLDYSINCFQCENCFACCGLVGKKHHILNKEYSPEQYKELREQIITHMKNTREWGQFFPGHFAPNPYDESLAGFHFPLTSQEQTKLGFRLNENQERANTNYASPSNVPDSPHDITDEAALTTQIFWDEQFKKPFQITPADIEFAKKLNTPLPNTYYMNRIQENFRWLPFNGKLRDATCGKCNVEIQTSWPEKYNTRILCEKCYQEIL